MEAFRLSRALDLPGAIAAMPFDKLLDPCELPDRWAVNNIESTES
jgi:hypothetical protein